MVDETVSDEESIYANPEVRELTTAIASAPDDEATQLVLADLLLSKDDLRGELIVLDRRERAGDLNDPVGLEWLLLLAAEATFPNPHPEAPTLPFHMLQPSPLTYVLPHDSGYYTVRFANARLVVQRGAINMMSINLNTSQRDRWSVDETIVILRLISDAIRAGAPLKELRFPFERDPLPIYPAGPLRAYRLPRDFTKPRKIPRDRFGLAARDHRRWMTIWHRLARILKQAR
jgi:hypothetical protein